MKTNIEMINELVILIQCGSCPTQESEMERLTEIRKLIVSIEGSPKKIAMFIGSRLDTVIEELKDDCYDVTVEELIESFIQ